MRLLRLRDAIADFGAVRRLDYPKRSLRIRADTMVELETRTKSCAKEPETVAWLERNAGPGAVMYDIGANVGAYSLVAASLGARVYAFEPAFQTFHALNRNVGLNGLDGKISAFPVALTSASKLALFKFLDLSEGTSKCWYNEKDYYHLPHGRPVAEKEVMAMTLDAFIHTFNLPSPTMLKIDVDGGELDVVRGAHDALRSPSLKTVLIEIDEKSGDTADILAALGDAGLREVSAHVREIGVKNRIFEGA